jgi:hypothetical protein
MDDLTPEQARAALADVERGRLSVVSQIDVPHWYWWALAAGWVVLGLVSDLEHPWITTGATLAFGAAHSMIAPRVVDGRHRSRRLSVRAEVAGPHIGRLVLAALVVLAGVTVVAALAVDADGAGHPTTAASVLVATMIVLGGPLLMTVVRNRAALVAS